MKAPFFVLALVWSLPGPLAAANDSIPASYARASLTEVGFAFYDDTKGVHLDWTNPYDEAVDGYEIHRSQSGQSWRRIVKLASRGKVGLPTHYEFVDTQPHNGVNYYRLVRHKTNGETEVTHELEIIHEGP